jgi:hypothetical protein
MLNDGSNFGKYGGQFLATLDRILNPNLEITDGNDGIGKLTGTNNTAHRLAGIEPRYAKDALDGEDNWDLDLASE